MKQQIIDIAKRHFYLRAGEHAQTSAGTFVQCVKRDISPAVELRRFLVLTPEQGHWVAEYIKIPELKHGRWSIMPYKTSIGSIIFRFTVKQMGVWYLGPETFEIFAITTLEALERLDEHRCWACGEWVEKMETALDIMNGGAR